MKLNSSVVIPILILGVLLATQVHLEAHENSGFEVVNAFIEAQMDRHRILGLALGIIKGDEVVYLRGFGSAGERREVTPQTPFYIGSVSKSFTALAVVQLVEDGAIDLDAPVQDYIPWFQVADEEISSQITVRHLLNQTSGLSEAGFRGTRLSSDITLEDTVRSLHDAKPSALPGRKYQYFNLNYNTLGLIVESVSGQPFGDYIREHIFAPLDMKHSFVSREAAERSGLAQGHNAVLGFPVARREPFLQYDLPAGFIISSAEDMAHYLIAQENGGRFKAARVLSAEGVEMMHRIPDGTDSPYAMGWEVHEREGVREVEHNGAVRTFYSNATLLPEQDCGFVLLINQNSAFHQLLAYEQIADGVANLLTQRQPPEGLAVSTLYWVITALILVDIGRRINSLRRLGQWEKRVQEKSRKRVLTGLVLKLLFPLLIMVAAPTYLITQAGLNATQVMLFNYLPDITAWITFSALLTMVEGVLQVRIVFRSSLCQWLSLSR